MKTVGRIVHINCYAMVLSVRSYYTSVIRHSMGRCKGLVHGSPNYGPRAEYGPPTQVNVLISIAINMKKGHYDSNNALLIGYISLDRYGCTVHNKIIN